MLTLQDSEKLKNMTNHSLRQLTALLSTWKASEYIDLSLITSAIQTLHIIKGLCAAHKRQQSSNVAHTIKYLLDNVAQGIISFSEPLAHHLIQAHSALLHAHEHGETKAQQTLAQAISELQPYISYIPETPKPTLKHANLISLGLSPHELEQLSEAESQIIDQWWNDNKLLMCYCAHVTTETLHDSIVATVHLIAHHGTLCSIISSYPQSPDFSHTFIFIFISPLPPNNLLDILQLPGTLHCGAMGKKPEVYTIQKKST